MPIVQSAAPPPRQSATVNPVAVGGLLIAVAILPGLFFFLGASSLAAGMAAAAVAILIADLTGILGSAPANKSAVGSILATLVLGIGLHLFVGIALAGQGDGGRAALSLIILVAMIIGAWILAARLPAISNAAIDRIMFALLGIFTLAALLSVVGLQPPSPRGVLAKSVFPFSEPSHYAFSVAPVIIFACIRMSFVPRGLVLVVFSAIAYALQSLSLVIVVIFTAAITLPIVWLALAAAVAIPLVTFIDTQYFTDRLDFSAHSTNISSLIYIQGIELAQSSWRETFGWGIGFQQLGVGEIHSLTANAISLILREDSNIYDGGFTGAKLVAEFGLLGLLSLTAYTLRAILMVFRIRRAIGGTQLPVAETLFASSFLGFMVELFVRGAGYFTGTSMLALASVFYFAHRARALSRSGDAHAAGASTGTY